MCSSKLNKFIIIFLLMMFSIIPVGATGYCVVENLDKVFKPNMTERANAICFFYKDAKYKCACKEPVNLKIWTSGDVSKIKGLSTHKIYGNIKDCEALEPQQGLGL